jgi:exonuclease III
MEKPLKLVTWNVAGLRPTVKDWKQSYGSVSTFLNKMWVLYDPCCPVISYLTSSGRLDADIACFQETKVSKADVTEHRLAEVAGYESFWAFSSSKRGYSGVVTFVRTAGTGADAGTGTGSGSGSGSGSYSPVAASVTALGPDFDGEGRCVVTDHGPFVLFNVYVPNAGEAPERERLPFKLRFLHALRHKSKSVQPA